jgi:hypothetical protein
MIGALRAGVGTIRKTREESRAVEFANAPSVRVKTPSFSDACGKSVGVVGQIRVAEIFIQVRSGHLRLREKIHDFGRHWRKACCGSDITGNRRAVLVNNRIFRVDGRSRRSAEISDAFIRGGSVPLRN